MSNTIGFDESFYLSQNPDVAAAVSRGVFTSGAQHYQLNGRFEGRNPNAFFNTSFYLGTYPDVAKAGINPLTHFLNNGAAEGRFANATEKAAIDLNNNGGADDFNEAAYRAQYSDVDAAIKAGTFKNAYQHFVQFGQFEARVATLANGTTITGPFSNTGVAPGTGNTFALTTGADNLTGTSGNDTFTALSTDVTNVTPTISAADVIRGGAGVDTLNVTVDGAATAITSGADIQGIEILNVRNVGTGNAALSAATVPGLTQINSDRSTGQVTVTNVASGTTVGVMGNGAATNGASSFTFVDAATTATANVSGGTTAGTLTVAGAGLTSVTINSTGAANTLGGLTLAATATTATINAATNLTTGTVTANGLTTLNVAGAAASVNVGTLVGTVTKVDASGLTAGGLTATLDTALTSFKGGQGNDVITTAAIASTVAASAIDAGAGTADRLIVGANGDVDSAAKAQKFAGFEILQVGTTTADASLFTNSAITGLQFSGSGTINNVNATQAGNITVSANAAPTIGVSGATNVGQIDTVKITVDDGATAVSTITLGNINVAGVENVQLVANDKITVSSLTGATAANSYTISGSQDVSITTGALATVANTAVNASALTGKFTFDGSLATGNGLAITGSATAINTITGTANADRIVGGAAADVITGGNGSDILTGGAGADTFKFGVGSSGGAPAATVFDTITDFGKASDIIDHTNAITFQATTAAAVAGTAAIGATGIATFNAADTTFAQQITAVESAINAGTNTAGETAIFQSGSDSYVFISDGVAGVGADDVLIKLTGVTGLTAGTINANGDLTIA